MTSHALSIANDVVLFLESIEGGEKEQALSAASIIRSHLKEACCQEYPDWGRLRYDLGGKGVLDWRWSEAVYARLERLCDEFYIASASEC